MPTKPILVTRPVNPKRFGLTAATRMEASDDGAYAIVIRRKSRIVMQDGRGILAKVAKIRAQRPGARVSVRTSAPVCSKTRAFLQEQGIAVEPLADP